MNPHDILIIRIRRETIMYLLGLANLQLRISQINILISISADLKVKTH